MARSGLQRQGLWLRQLYGGGEQSKSNLQREKKRYSKAL